MDAEQNEELDAVNIMTLHSAKGLEFETVFLPGWEEGLFPHQRSLDEGGRSGLEEERRLAYVGLTRAKKNLHIWFVSNRRIHGLWQSTIPSRFLDELPEAHVEVDGRRQFLWRLWRRLFAPGRGGFGAGRQNPYGASRFDNLGSRRASRRGDQERHRRRKPSPTPMRRRAGSAPSRTAPRRPTATGAPAPATPSSASAMARPIRGYGAGRGSVKGRTIDGELVAKSVSDDPSPFNIGDRVFHQKFGNGNIAAIDGNKLTIDFDRAGQKKVLDGFVTGV